MAKKLPTIWRLEPHTAAKHAILRRYLHAWLPIMARYNGRIIYLDAFAGPGVYSVGEPGSPIIALRAAMDQRAHLAGEIIFLFIEENEERVASLNDAIAALAPPPQFKIAIRHGDCAETITKLLDYVDAKNAGLAPTFAFLDPFGFSDTPLSLVQRLMSQPRCEVLVTFMFEEINRFLSHEDLPDHFDGLFGTAEWRDALNRPTPEERRRFLKELYQRQLRSEAAIKYVLAFEMRNQANALDYILFFGTNSIEGLKKMKEAMWKVDPVAGFTFSDATDPDQVVFFAAQPDSADVRRRLVERFRGHDAGVEEIERFLLEETPYRETHYKALVLKLMESESPPSLAIVAAKLKRRRGDFPAGTVVRFL